MIVYFSILLLLIYLICVYDKKKQNKGREQWINVFLFLLIVIAGLRYHIGSDTVIYESKFNNDIPLLKDAFKDADLWSQPLWILLMSLVKTIFNSFIAFQFVHAIIFNTLLFRFIRRTTDKFFSALFFVLCVTWWNLSFEILRESLCVVIFLNGLLFLKERQYLKYVIICFVMMGIHWFSFVVALLAPVALFMNSKISIPTAVLVSIVLLYSTSFMSMLEIVSLGFFEGGAASGVMSYLYYNENEGLASNNIIGILRILLMSFILPILTIYFNKKDNSSSFFNRVLVLYLLFGVLQLKMVIFGRFLNYLNPILIVCFINVLYHRKNIVPLMRIGLSSLVFLYLVFGCMSFYRPSYLERRPWVKYNCSYIPYKTVFQEPDPVREGL